MDPEFHLKRLETENRRLKRAVEELSVLNEVALAVSSASALEQVIDLIVQKCVKHLHVEQGAVLLIDQGQEQAPLKTMVRKVRSDVAGIPFRLGDQLTGWMLKNQQPLLIADLTNDQRFRLPPEAASMRNLLCVPLRLKGRMVGVLSAFNKVAGEEFSESDQRLLMIIAAQSAQVIEAARLYEEEQSLALIEQELRTARDIQRRLLPKIPPEIPGYDIAGRSEPARSVGGDYFDFLSAGQGRVGICLADVSGKGISAALVMAAVQATVRGQSLTGLPVAEQVGHANRLLYDSTESDKFVTMFYSVLEPATGALLYTNAGHNPPVIFSADAERPRLLEIGGPVLGVLPTIPFAEGRDEIARGDTLIVYSDGISEAMNFADEEYGEERLYEVVRRNRDISAAALVDRVFADVKTYCGDAPQTDDMSMTVVRRLFTPKPDRAASS